MANDKMMAQISSKAGFIAALDQSGGSTPGALRLYGIPDSAYSGEAEMFRLMHEMRVRIMTAPAFTGAKVIAAILFEGTMDGQAAGQACSDLPVGGARRRPVPESRQGARAGERRRQPDEADTWPRRAARARGEARHLRHQDALRHQPGLEDRDRRDCGAAVRRGRADRRAWADAHHRAGGSRSRARTRPARKTILLGRNATRSSTHCRVAAR